MFSMLYCSGNRLTNLDLSQNPDLSTLECRNNKLTSLDLSHNTNLLRLDYRGNPDLGEVDISMLHYLEELNEPPRAKG